MKQAIETRFVGPTNHRGARIVVRAEAGRMTVGWDHALGVEENHTAAARAFAARWGWSGTWHGGALPGRGYAFVLHEVAPYVREGSDFFVVPSLEGAP